MDIKKFFTKRNTILLLVFLSTFITVGVYFYKERNEIANIFNEDQMYYKSQHK